MDGNPQLLPPAVTEADSLEGLTRPILEILEAVSGLDSTYLTMIDEPAGEQRILYSRNSRRLQIPEQLAVPWGDTLCKRALEEGVPYADDVETRWADSQAAKALGIRTYVSQPVRTLDGALYGTLCGASDVSVALQPSTLEVLAKFARLIAQQVDRERALQTARRVNTELASQSLADPLTGLANRRRLDLELTRMLSESQRRNIPLQVAVVDLDGFKAINDQFGHETGDRFLVHIARKLTAALRPEDFVARTGGDEFIALAHGDTSFYLRQRLEAATLGPFEHGPCVLDYRGASVGVATASPGDNDRSALLKRADAAMYAMKRSRKAGRTDN